MQKIRGFYIHNKFYSSGGNGHEETARKIAIEHGWKLPKGMDYQDYIVVCHGAIQLGSGAEPYVIIGYFKFYTREELEKFAKSHNLCGYKIILQEKL